MNLASFLTNLAALLSFLLGALFSLFLVIGALAGGSGLVFLSLMALCFFLASLGFIKRPQVMMKVLKYLSYGALTSLALGYFADYITPMNYITPAPVGGSVFRQGVPLVWAERHTMYYRGEIVTVSSSYSLSFLWADVVFWAVIIGLSVILYGRYRTRRGIRSAPARACVAVTSNERGAVPRLT